MLTKLRDIVHKVASSGSVSESLEALVRETCLAMDTECCSVYIADHQTQTYELMASQGLEASSGSVILDFGEGLVGLVGKRAEPINVANVKKHPRFKHFPETGEDVFHSFLGTPIIYRREVLGILVVQQKDSRHFDESEESFLVTLAAQLAVIFAHAKAQGLWPENDATVLGGAAASQGIAIAQAWFDLNRPELDDVLPASTLNQPRDIERLEDAINAACADFRKFRKRLDLDLNADVIAIFDLFTHLLNDPMLRDAIVERIKQGDMAEWALKQAVDSFVERFGAMSDPYLKQRASDIRELGQRLLLFLQQQASPDWQLDTPIILLARELTAGMLASIPRNKLAGIVAEEGAVNAHAAILARAMGIPAVMGVDFRPASVHGKQIVLDGYQGKVFVEPSPVVLQEYEKLLEEEAEIELLLDSEFTENTQLADGTNVEIHLNAGLSADTGIAINHGVDGVGLYRTEIPFLMQSSFPSEDDQSLLYQSILEAYRGQPVVMRSLDIGGDKPLPYLTIEEDNPFLGWRGIRFTLDHPDIFLIQIRAMLRASIGLDNLAILLPMVSGLNELLDAKILIDRAFEEVMEMAEAEGKTLNRPHIGVMVEVPSILYQLDAVAKHADFISVGTNDLTQYLLAVDRNNVRVSDVYDSLHPSVIAALQNILQTCQRNKLPVCVCGELAGDPLGAMLLVGMGYRQLSMNTRSVARIKYVLRHLSVKSLEKHINTISRLPLASEIRTESETFLKLHNLGDILRVGR
ncbi:phosphoenolpyruvate--protein phosphotransferase PtsP [Veronia nyctiphanis]|uniref:phosphoenolpyruvate--protein phosphotransferase n=1 Tax=Veronia nyctiphanis TaxID=1278244 RepID=A0A4Q0YX19_9GAMM|nr:phosphoenolpyruvate--protein phosphotransferase [Veronia nyctiphanis]RXJ73789.1 phosphoenolpyruvate--protein phosphotransferase PtsP [Veronia nyctiphanis]